MEMLLVKERNKRLRFTFDDDIVLLREIVAHNPIANPEKWDVVQQNMERIVSKKFFKRTLKQHLQLLLEVWMKKDAICKIRSGNEEPYSEKDTLLQEISMLCHETEIQNKNKSSKVSKEKVIAQIGREARENIALSFAKSDEDALAYLKEKHDTENKIRLKELELEEKRLSIRAREIAVEERKLKLLEDKQEMEKSATTQKMELDKERFKWELTEKKSTISLLESQQKIIDNLLNNFHN